MSLIVVFLLATAVQAAPPTTLLSTKKDLFFEENNLVYRRYLALFRDGSYRQINQDRAGTSEADRGTWDQSADATILLHSSYRGLRFRAIRSGPLTVLLDSLAKIDALPQLLSAIQRQLDQSQTDIFLASTVADLRVPPVEVTVDQSTDSFQRSDLTALAGRVFQTIRTEQTRTYLLTPIRPPGGPLLLALQGATFGSVQIPETYREYRVPRGAPPPFYFAQVDEATFARRVGRWRELEPVLNLPAP